MRSLFKNVVMAVGMGLSTPVFAHYVVTVSPTMGPPTQAVTVAGKGFEDGEPVDVYIDAVNSLLVFATATDTFNATGTIPEPTTSVHRLILRPPASLILLRWRRLRTSTKWC